MRADAHRGLIGPLGFRRGFRHAERLLTLIGDALVAFGVTSVLISVDEPRAAPFILVAVVILVAISVALAGSHLASLGSQALNPRLPVLAPHASWWGFRAFAMVIGLWVALFIPAQLPLALLPLVSGLALIALARAFRSPSG